MQVLCISNEGYPNVECKICGQKYALYFERSSQPEQEEAIEMVQQTLVNHHVLGNEFSVHPQKPFNVPAWSGPAHMSGAAILGGAPIGPA
jgi:hypothetical protein